MEIFMKCLPYLIFACIVGGYAIYLAAAKPKKIKEWLIIACAQAESALGSGTGMLKLRFVYDMFVKQYPIVSQLISFKKFQEMTEESLATLKDWLEKNPKVDLFFGGEDK